MAERKDGLLAVLRREPDETSLLLKLGIFVPIAIMVWDRAAGYFLSPLIIAPVTFFFVVLFGAVFAYLLGRLVHDSDRFQVESTFHARRLLSGIHRETPKVGELLPAPAAPTGTLFDYAFFKQRLEDEVRHARQEGAQMSVIALYVGVPGESARGSADRVGLEVAQLVAGQITISRKLCVGENEFVFSLPHSGEKAAKLFVSEMVQALGEYWCHFGIATFPVQATSADELYSHARALCQASREDMGQVAAEPEPVHSSIAWPTTPSLP